MASSKRPALIRVSPKCYYGCKALVELARHYPNGLVQTAQIARHQKIPARFLTHVLHDLKVAGLVVSEKGKYGGFRLMRPPATIRFGHIVRAVCDITADGSWTGRHGGGDALDRLFQEQWRQAAQKLEQSLDRLTLKDIMREIDADAPGD